MTDKKHILQTSFGLSDFRPGQESILDALEAGRDVLAIMPDGSGKALSWQLHAAGDGLTLALFASPSSLKKRLARLEAAGIPAVQLDRRDEHHQKILSEISAGTYRVVCTTPSQLAGPDLLSLASVMPVSMVAVEDAHRISPRSPDYRPDYQHIPHFVRLLPKRPSVGAFTPNVDPALRRDIQCLMLLHDPVCVIAGYQQNNLHLDVTAPLRKDTWLLNFLRNHPKQTGLICCSSLQQANEVCSLLLKSGLDAKLAPSPGETAKILVTSGSPFTATDRPNLRFLIHYTIPRSLSDYVRQLAAAGRDGQQVRCTLLFSPADVQAAWKNVRRQPNQDIQTLALEQLVQLTDYCRTTDCLWNYLLQHLDLSPRGRCGRCGNCICQYIQQDITREARLILTTVNHMEDKFSFGLGRHIIVPMLKGKQTRQTQNMKLDQMDEFGALNQLSIPQIRAYINSLIRDGCLYTTESPFPVLRCTHIGIQALKNGSSFTYRLRMKKSCKQAKSPQLELTPRDASLFRELQALRTSIAHETDLPAYVIFANTTLTDMAQQKPQTLEGLLRISGVGKTKASRYGARFLACIQAWIQKN